MKISSKDMFPHEIVEHLFPDLNKDQRQRVMLLFTHAFDHPWVDDEIKESMIQNICNEYKIDVPDGMEDF